MLVSMRAWIRAEWMPNPVMCEGCSPRSRPPDLPTLQGWCARRSRPDSARDGACASGGRCGSRCWVVGVTAGQPSDSPCTSAVGEASKVVLRSDCFDGPRAVAERGSLPRLSSQPSATETRETRETPSATQARRWCDGMQTPPQPIRPRFAVETLPSDHPVLVSTEPPPHASPAPRAPAAGDIDQLGP